MVELADTRDLKSHLPRLHSESTRGFDYLCLQRTPEHTRKVYFFDGKVSQLRGGEPEGMHPTLKVVA